MSETECELLSYLSLKPHIKTLRACGILSLSWDTPFLKRKLHNIYMCFSFFFIMLYTIQQIVNVYQVRGDVDKIMDSMFLLLTFCDSICKQIVFLIYPHNIQELFEIMKGPYFNQGLEEHRPLLLKTVYQAQLLLKIFNKLCLLTCILWVLFPIISHFKQETVEFTIWLPFDANTNPQFYVAIFYVWLQTTWLGYNNSTMDIFIVYLFAQTKTQLSILRIDLENLVSRCKVEAVCSSTFNDLLEKRLKGVIHHYNEIIKFSTLNERIFNGPILFQFLISGWIICTTAYRTINMSPASGEFLSMILYMICIFSELFLFCFFGNEVAYESEILMESAYGMEWPELQVKHRRFLIIFMERIKYPIKPKAGKIVPLSINTFVQIVKTSYTFFTFLNKARK
ncbi:odorant receptor 94b-like [Choristoneura fumiferana]|uniref:odorant receptor 94b-like n=1 Tax=Choristoneura fumiferana TaxID=7141 RepID=UPI003D1573F1